MNKLLLFGEREYFEFLEFEAVLAPLLRLVAFYSVCSKCELTQLRGDALPLPLGAHICACATLLPPFLSLSLPNVPPLLVLLLGCIKWAARSFNERPLFNIS